MKQLTRFAWRGLLVTCLLCELLEGHAADSPTPIVYTLVEGSQFLDDCPICDRATIRVPMRGSFQLRLLEAGPLFSTYAVENLSLTSASTNGWKYALQGKGTYRVGGEVAFQQYLFLEASVDNGFTNFFCYFTNSSIGVTRLWPMLQIGVDQTNGTFVQQFHLDLHAAPFRELWFSTTSGFKVPQWADPTNLVSYGDLLSTSGRIVRRNSELVGRLGVQPIVPDLGAANVQVLQGGELAFSITQDVFSETLGQLRSGDLLSDAGRIVARNEVLLAPFGPESTNTDVGLDSAQFMDGGQFYFSVQTNFFSLNLSRKIGRGDLLSDNGAIVKSNAELLTRFGPIDNSTDYGLKTAYVWPSGEIWFSLEQGFADSNSVYYAPGDILSDQGFLIYRNDDLLFDLTQGMVSTNVGLDSLFVISDVFPLNPNFSKTLLNVPVPTNEPPGSLLLRWTRGGRVFQVERAGYPDGPYFPLSQILTDGAFVDAGALTNSAAGYYRIHQW